MARGGALVDVVFGGVGGARGGARGGGGGGNVGRTRGATGAVFDGRKRCDLGQCLLQERAAAVDLDVPGALRTVERTARLSLITLELGDLFARGNFACVAATWARTFSLRASSPALSKSRRLIFTVAVAELLAMEVM